MNTSALPGGNLRLQILGPLRIWRDDVELEAGPRQQAYLFAILLVREGRPTSVSELIDLMWGGDVPVSAVNIVQKYVGSLRRLLEPALPAREAGSYLKRHGSGYLFTAPPGSLDATDFRVHLDVARVRGAQGHSDEALDSYVRALDLWHGPAGDGLLHGPTALPFFSGLNDQFFNACLAAAELAVSRGQPERVLQSLRLAAWMAPLHEGLQANLIATLAAAGQQSEALSVFEAARARLAEDLGIDPGPELRAAHADVLIGPRTSLVPANGPLDREPSTPGSEHDTDLTTAGLVPSESAIGRLEELTVLRNALDSACAGAPALVVIEGEPGSGKTRLIEELASEMDQRGGMVVWGRCLDQEGTPPMWPWMHIVARLLDDETPARRHEWHSGELGRLLEPRSGSILGGPVLPDNGAQFRLFEQSIELMRHVCAERSAMIVVDDLHWADVASLQMFGHVAMRLPISVLLVGALRNRAPAPGPDLARTLAAVSRLPRHRRIRLGPLQPAEVAELVRRETGQDPSHQVARSIQARTAGNPFFVCELARLLAESGSLATDDAAGVARAGVPSTVRDIVQDRMAGLSDETRTLVQVAALIGRDVEIQLLARAARIDAATCMERLEPAESLGLLGPDLQSPFTLRFAHDLVRESVARSTSSLDTGRLHLQIADALEPTTTSDESTSERLAHHLCLAGPLADPARTTTALVRAGRRAVTQSAFDAAVPCLTTAASVSRESGHLELELSALSQLVAVIGMQSGYMGDMESTATLLERAEQVARMLGREREAADFLFSRWAAHSQGIQLDRSGRLARLLLDEGEASSDSVVQAYGRHAWGIHQWDVGNIGEAYRYLSQSNAMVVERSGPWEEEPLRHDLQMLSPVMLALNTALHGDVDGARQLLDRLEAEAGEHSYDLTVWSAFAVTVAAVAGHPGWALRAAERGIAADPELSFSFLGTYQRLGHCWARAMTGQDVSAAAADAEELIGSNLLDPPRSGLATWCALLAEMYLAAGRLDDAATALDRAALYLETYNQRYAEGLMLLIGASLRHARGESVAAVTAAAEEARALSEDREAYLFAHRAEDMLSRLGTATSDRTSSTT